MLFSTDVPEGGLRVRYFVAAVGAFALAVAVAPPPAAAGPSRSLPFIENDFPQALARAREAGVPVFVEVWAPW
jgi:hypothetical protein